ncbi:chemotaxis protein CheA [Paenibacillus monticola]|uniref:Chemotaxis protein CheA n=1 Tax=Paenibacillus monticola TaxID=2666075 RepID=A0A7X2H5M8_9BACL|nr:chemotaxis protein CheA [Paenibacillus monticola]MRN54029.1 chemotaxis protein CheA [Paenibacillus monticola]
MSEEYINEPMLEIFIYETSLQLEQLEQKMLENEDTFYKEEVINEIFRHMHSIKSASSMMLFNEISKLAHSIEDLFYVIREEKPVQIDYSMLSDLVFEGIDFIKIEILKIKEGADASADASELIQRIKRYLEQLKELNPSLARVEQAKVDSPKKQQFYISNNKKVEKTVHQHSYQARVFFEEGCEMENIRAFTIIHNLKDFTTNLQYEPSDIIESEDSVDIIRDTGFLVSFKTNRTYDEMFQFFSQTIFLRDLELTELVLEDSELELGSDPPVKKFLGQEEQKTGNVAATIISVQVQKLDRLLDLVGEMVIAEAMVTENPDLMDLELDNFQKAARQLKKITSEIQDMVMSIRMISLSTTFQKMNRPVRDMCKKLNKEVKLSLIGEDTEVDKNIIEHLSDPLMHLIRNSMDHGFESPAEREQNNKPRTGTLTLEAKNVGSDVLIIVKDDGRGLNKSKILQKAHSNGLLRKAESEYTHKEIFNLILHPGFSTKEQVTEFSGRGVGMDVVANNVETIGGSLQVDSTEDKGTVITIRIPITLAIVDAMNIRVGQSKYTIPTSYIKESLRPKTSDLIVDPNGNEMIIVRGLFYPLIRLHERLHHAAERSSLLDGIVIILENDDKSFCILADELLGQKQVVVKALPSFFQGSHKVSVLAGCTLLGDGSISLILDIPKLSG